MITALSIGVSGLRAASARLNASAANIANIGTTGAMAGTADATTNPVYRPVRVAQQETASGGVAYTVQQRPQSTRASYDPTAPYADRNGMVASPDIDLASELIDVLQARLQFKASARVIRAASDTERSAINLLA